jgi:hypothetical protein
MAISLRTPGKGTMGPVLLYNGSFYGTAGSGGKGYGVIFDIKLLAVSKAHPICKTLSFFQLRASSSRARSFFSDRF